MTADHFKHTIKDISRITSLSENFVSRAHSYLSGFFKDYRAYGDNNQVSFSDSGLRLWDRIGQLKNENKNLPDIRTTLERELQNPSQNPAQVAEGGRGTPQNGLSNQAQEADKESVTLIKNLYERLLDKAENETELVRTKFELLLPEGKTPDQVKADIEEKNKLAYELERLQQTVRERKEKDRLKDEKRKSLLEQIANLSVFQAKEKKRLIDEIKKLDL